MKRLTVALLLLFWTLTLAVIMTVQILPPSVDAVMQAKIGPLPQRPWEYASLVIDDATLGVTWQAGKTTLNSPGDVKKLDLDHTASDMYRQLGGKEKTATLGMLLDVVGQNGWEMVSYTHPSGAQIWMFKRPSQ